MNQASASGKRGCMFYGCLVAGVALLIIVLGGLVGLYYARKMLKDFTTANSAPLPAITLSSEELAITRQKLEDFRKNLLVDRTTTPLELTAGEINGLIADSSDLKSFSDHFRLFVEKGQPKAHISVPMERLNLPVFRGRYLNGLADLDASLNNGVLRIFIKQIKVNGIPIPEAYLKEIQKQNLARGLNDDPRAKPVIEKVESLQIKDDRVILTPLKVP